MEPRRPTRQWSELPSPSSRAKQWITHLTFLPQQSLSLYLYQGANHARFLSKLTGSATGGSYTWTPTSVLNDGLDYSLQLVYGSNQQAAYSGEFAVYTIPKNAAPTVYSSTLINYADPSNTVPAYVPYEPGAQTQTPTTAQPQAPAVQTQAASTVTQAPSVVATVVITTAVGTSTNPAGQTITVSTVATTTILSAYTGSTPSSSLPSFSSLSSVSSSSSPSSTSAAAAASAASASSPSSTASSSSSSTLGLGLGLGLGIPLILLLAVLLSFFCCPALLCCLARNRDRDRDRDHDRHSRRRFRPRHGPATPEMQQPQHSELSSSLATDVEAGGYRGTEPRGALPGAAAAPRGFNREGAGRRELPVSVGGKEGGVNELGSEPHTGRSELDGSPRVGEGKMRVGGGEGHERPPGVGGDDWVHEKQMLSP